jgi:A/G-specific adenine glycosylase
VPASLSAASSLAASLPAASLPAAATATVLGWYAVSARPLAFRSTSDPWAILVSEFMAQQTQAARAAEAWTRFLAEFPTPAALAAATPAAALRAWRGLGYNRRALALRATAVIIVAEHDGQVPGELEALRRLPGVGPYTARAIAALAFGRRVGAVDTNVRRVLTRAIGGRDGLEAASVQIVADELVPVDRPGLWTHALMDIGATFCKARTPRCEACPLQPWCRFASMADAVTRWPPAQAAGRPRATTLPFRSSSRWLRGRILDRLRDTVDGEWVRFDDPIGEHDRLAVVDALLRLARDRLVEIDPSSRPAEARLPIG